MGAVVDIHESLVARCKQGDRKAQYELYRLYTKAMFNIAMRITHDYMEAEDVLQEAFVRAFKNIGSFKGDSTFGAWLKRIVINTAINHVKKKKLEFVEVEDRHMEVAEAPVADSFDINVSGVSMDKIRKAISMLPEGYRMVFSLYLLEGYDHQEIGTILGVSEATSKSQYSRAKKKLRQLLSQQEL